MNDLIEIKYNTNYTENGNSVVDVKANAPRRNAPKFFRNNFRQSAPKKVDDRPQYWVNLTNLDSKDKMNMRSMFSAANTKDGKKTGFMMRDPNNADDEGRQNFLNAFKYLQDTGKYKMPNIDLIFKDLNNAPKDNVSPDVIKNVNQSVDEKMLDLIKRIHDPQIQELIKSLGSFVYPLGDSTFGHKYSIRNVARILTQKSDATFVQTRNQWRDRFNRIVKDDATPITIVYPYKNTSFNIQDKTRQMELMGYDVKGGMSYHDLSQQQKNKVDIELRESPRGSGICNVYDISDTEKMDSNDNTWENEPGLDNNLTGHLNQAALSQKMSGIEDNEDAVEKAKGIYDSDENDPGTLCEILEKQMAEKYPNIKFKKPQSNDKYTLSECFEMNVSNLADSIIENECKIVKKENRARGVDIATTFVMCSLRLSPLRVIQKLASNDLSEESYIELRDVINEILRLVDVGDDNLTNESKNYITEVHVDYIQSVDQMLNLMGIDANQLPSHNSMDMEDGEFNNEENNVNSGNMSLTECKKNFYDIFNRINKQYF